MLDENGHSRPTTLQRLGQSASERRSRLVDCGRAPCAGDVPEKQRRGRYGRDAARARANPRMGRLAGARECARGDSLLKEQRQAGGILQRVPAPPGIAALLREPEFYACRRESGIPLAGRPARTAPNRKKT